MEGKPEFTERQLDVLSRLADGYSDREIAEELVISVRTVSGHVVRILDLLELKNRREARRWFKAHMGHRQ